MNARGTEIFYIPTLYLFKVRLEGNIWRLLSWWFIMIVPTGGYSVLMNDSTDSMELLRYFILTLAVVSYYELGYVNNDMMAFSEENAPTIRMNDREYRYCLSHISSIMVTRLSFIAALLIIYAMMSPLGWKLVVTICSVLFLLPLFGVYNHTRSHARVLFYPILVSARYLVFLCPFIGIPDFGILMLLLLLSYPVEIGIERFSMPKRRYGFMDRIIQDEESKTRFRAIYYFALLVLFVPLWIEKPEYCLPILVIGIYRWARLLMQVVRKNE